MQNTAYATKFDNNDDLAGSSESSRPRKIARRENRLGTSPTRSSIQLGEAVDNPQHPVQLLGRPRTRGVTACRVCRSRKTKCDNTGPPCGYCASVGAECSYIEGALNSAQYVQLIACLMR
jgi:hypothetical protein